VKLNQGAASASPPRRPVANYVVPACLLALVGLVCGLGLFLATPSTYTAESRIAVGHETLSAIQVPGYVSATQQLASDYARYVQDTLSERSQLPDGGAGVRSISASPIPESNIIRVEVQATTAFVAVADAKAVTESLLEKVSGTNPDLQKAQQAFSQAYVDFQKAEAQATAAGDHVAALRANPSVNRSALDAAQAVANQQSAEAARLDLEQQALGANYRAAYSDAKATPSLTIMRSASGGVSDWSSRLQRDLLMGVLGGVLLACAYVYLRERRSGRTSGRLETGPAGGAAEREIAPAELVSASPNGRPLNGDTGREEP
jgi:hypothetical protein